MKVLKYFPLLILLVFLIKTLITPVGVSEAIILVGLASLYGFWSYLEFIKEPPVNQDVKNELIAAKAEIVRINDEIDKLKAYVSASKLSTSKRF